VEPLSAAGLSQYPDEIGHVVIQMAADRSRPPMTLIDVLDALERSGVPTR
jgi:hypothetical protein